MKKVLKQINMMLEKRQKKGLFFLFLGALLVALVDTLSVSLMAPFMALLMDMDGIESGSVYRVFTMFFGKMSSLDLLKILSLFFILLYLARGILKLLYNFWQARLFAIYRTELSKKLFAYVMRKPYDYHLHHNTAETQRLVNSDASCAYVVVQSLMLTASSGLVSVGILSVLLSMDWKMTLVLIVVVLLFLLFVRRHLKGFVYKMADKNYLASSEMNKWINQAIGGLKTIYVKQKQEYYIGHYEEVIKSAAIAQSNYAAVDSLPKVMLDTLCMVMVFGVVFVQLLIGNDLMGSLPVFATFAVAALRLVPVFGQVAGTINSMAFYRPSLDAVCEILQTGALKEQADKMLQNPDDDRLQNIKEIQKGIEVSHVSFHYKDTDKMLFNDLSLTIPAKKSVAFVGTTGAGKTTLADIILGLHEPTSGNVLVDGLDIHQYPATWAKLVGYIPQFIYLSDDSIRANVALGDSQQTISDAWVWDCLERAQMKEFVEGLPDGLDTMIGENGIRLSGGQRQRLGIARALYCKPQFLLMDEATSSLDNDTEKAIVDSINSLSGDLTMLIIAHRLTTIEDCDLIYRIEDGGATLEKGKL